MKDGCDEYKDRLVERYQWEHEMKRYAELDHNCGCGFKTDDSEAFDRHLEQHEREQANERQVVQDLATGPYEAALHPVEPIESSKGWCIVNARREVIASVYGGGTQALIDARVMAASFDLLRALRMQMSWTMRDGSPCCCPAGEREGDMPRPKKMPTVHASVCVEARAAIKKAQGAA